MERMGNWLTYWHLSRRRALNELSLRLDGIEEPRQWLNVAFLGAFSSGKSTLVNNLLGEVVAETHTNPTQSCWTRYLFSKIPCFRIREAENGHYRTVVELGGAEIFRRWFENESLNKYLPRPHEVSGAVVEIGLPNTRLQKGVVLHDSPGHDSTAGDHRRLAEKIAKEADALMYLFPVDHIMSEADIDFLKPRLKEGKPIACVVTKVGPMIDAPTRLVRLRSHVTEVLEDLGECGDAPVLWAPEPMKGNFERENDVHHRVSEIWRQIENWWRNS
jgi:GTPase SAR1 family protein